MQLAELNIADWKVEPSSPVAAGFVNNVGRINALAERSLGFVWRKIDEERDYNGYNAIGGPLMLMTLSVWETRDDLANFVWNTVHKKIYANRALWFRNMENHHMVFWQVENGHRPSILEAKQRLDHLDTNGDTDFAFGWSYLNSDGSDIATDEQPNSKLKAAG